MSGISTHILDTAAGKPAAGVRIRLFQGDRLVGDGLTNDDGRWSSAHSEQGIYRILFEIGEKFPNGFYPIVEISFRVADATAHYHVPLLLSPFGYTTYRGS